MDIFAAATQTTMNATQTMITHFATAQESLAKVRKEFTAFVQQADPSADLTKIGLKEILRKYVNHDTCTDLAYLSNVTNEALRVMPVVPMTSQCKISQDSQIGQY
jgi:cytochrome P450